MTVNPSYIDVEAIQASVADKKPMYEQKIRTKIAQLTANMQSKEAALNDAKNQLDKFKADVSNCMTEHDTANFISLMGL